MGNFTSDALIRGNLHSDFTSCHFTAVATGCHIVSASSDDSLFQKSQPFLPAYQTLALPGARRGPEGVNATPKPLEHIIRPLDYRPLSLLSLLRQEENRSDQLQALQGCTSVEMRMREGEARWGTVVNIFETFPRPAGATNAARARLDDCLLHVPVNLWRA